MRAAACFLLLNEYLCSSLTHLYRHLCMCVCVRPGISAFFLSLPAPLPHLVTPHSRYFRALWAISVCTWPGSSPERTHLSRRRKDFSLELENKSDWEERCAERRRKSGTRLAKREERCEEEEEGEEGTDLPVFPLGFLLFFFFFGPFYRDFTSPQRLSLHTAFSERDFVLTEHAEGLSG